MKTFLFSFLLLIWSMPSAICQLPGQPECLGMTASHAYATLFEESRLYGLSCSHFHPSPGEVVTFGNGQTAVVKAVCQPRGGYFQSYQYDIGVVEFTQPVAAAPAKVYWQKPSDLVNGSIEIDGFGLDGWFHGTAGTVIDNFSVEYEVFNGIWFSTPAGTVRGGYSGSPVFYRGHLIGINWGGSSDGSGGVANTIWQVLGQYWDKFPVPLHPPAEPSCKIMPCGNMLEVILTQAPGTGCRIQSSCDLSAPTWIAADCQPGFCGYEEATVRPWETVLRWDPTTSPSMFFRGGP